MQINKERREKLVDVLSDVLNRLCERNNRFTPSNTPVTRFHALRPPQIAIKVYLERIAKYSNCSEECFVLALIYIDRLIRTNGSFLVNSYNVHRMIITSVMLAAKFFDDQYFNNAHFGRVGGVSCKEINLLEIEFLFMINFNLFVENDLYTTYDDRLMSHGQQNETSSSDADEPSVKPPTNALTPDVSNKPSRSPGSLQVTDVGSAQAVTPSSITQRQVQRSKPVGASAVRRVRHFPPQRCTPPSYSPKILQANERIPPTEKILSPKIDAVSYEAPSKLSTSMELCQLIF